MNQNPLPLTYKKILAFWYPLAASWLMMSVEGPFIAAVIARLAEPKFNLAAYGVSFAVALVVESPIIMLLSASTALCRNNDAHGKLLRFTWALNILITTGMLIFLIPPVFNFLIGGLMGLPPEITRLTHVSVILLLPWPAAIGIRRFYQGVMIRYGLTRRVALGTVVRLSSMSLAALLMAKFGFPGAWVGCAALSAGVVMEAVAIRIMAHSCLKKLIATPPSEEESKNLLTYRYISKFYFPLIMMSFLSLGVQPIVTFFMNKGRLPIISLAVLPVINALLFIFRSLGLSYQEVIIALAGENREGYPLLKRFAVFIGTGVSAGAIFIGFTPFEAVWFRQVAGLSAELASYAYFPTKILTLLPALTVLVSFQRAVLVSRNNTSPILWGTVMEVVGIMGVLFIGVGIFNMIGVTAAAIAYITGSAMANIYLAPHQIRARK